MGPLTGSGTVTLAGGTVLAVSIDSGTTTFSGQVGGGDATSGLTKAGAGKLILAGSNSYTGPTRVDAGTLELSGIDALADTSAVTLANAAGVQLNVTRSETVGRLSGGGSLGGHVVLSSGAVLGTTIDTDARYDGNISGGNAAGGFIKQGVANLILGGTNTYAGATTVSQGRLQAASSTSLPANTPMQVASAGFLDLPSPRRSAPCPATAASPWPTTRS